MLLIFIINESKLMIDLIYFTNLQILNRHYLHSDLTIKIWHIPFTRNRSMAHCLLDTILAIMKLALPAKTSILCFERDSWNGAFLAFSFSLFGLTSTTLHETNLLWLKLILFYFKVKNNNVYFVESTFPDLVKLSISSSTTSEWSSTIVEVPKGFSCCLIYVATMIGYCMN